jgi:hypothetical protein
MIQPTYVTFEQAKLLKSKGFNETCSMRYNEEGEFTATKLGMNGFPNDYSSSYSAPEQWQVVEWASLVHNIDIEARPVRYAGDIKTSYYQSYINGCVLNFSKFTTKQEALSEAINEFLKII